MAATTTMSATLGVHDDEARSRVLERVRRYVEIETPSGNEAALNELADIVARDAEALGGSVERFAAPGFGTNLLITFAGGDGAADRTADDAAHAAAARAHAATPVVVLTHIDTVHPVGTLATQPFRIVDDRVEGPGVYDMKCGLVLALEAIATLRSRGARPGRPVQLLVTCDEEIGSHSSHELIERLARGAAAVLVPEPSVPGGGVKTARKGVATYDLHVSGRAAHAGIEPGRAVSAVTEMALQIIELLELADHARGTTINVGTVRGGTATNVVAASASAGIDVRSVNAAEAARVRAGLERLAPKLAGASVRIELAEQRPPLERTEQVVRLYEHARSLAAELGVALAEGSTGGGSDGSIAAAVGAPTLDGLGADGGGAHAIDEHVLLYDLPFRVALWTRLLETL